MNRETTPEEIAEAAPASAARIQQVIDELKAASLSRPAGSGQQRTKINGIAILGSNPASVEQAPFDDPSWLIYACSPHNVEHRTLPRVDQWFEVHKPICDTTRQYRYLRTVEDMPFVWMRDEDALPLFKGGRPYPEKRMKSIFCDFLFRSSISYMQAVAIDDCCGEEWWRHHLFPPPAEMREEIFSNVTVEEKDGVAYMVLEACREVIEKHGKPPIPMIGLWGVHQASKNEYYEQRDGIQYFIWEALRRGIRVMAPEDSKLFEHKPDNW